MSKVLRSLMVKVGADLSQFDKGMKKMARDLKKTGQQLTNTGKALTKGLTVPILAAAAASIKFAADFEVSLAKVETIADTTSKSMNELKAEVLAISDATGTAGTEINEALYQAISAGADTAKATKLVEVAVKAAKGGFTDTTTAVDGLTSTLNTYNMETEDAQELANKYLVTQNKGKTTFGELAGSLGTVTATAKAAGVDIDNLLASIAALTANGIKTEMAVTGVKAALSNIIKPSEEAMKVAKELGIDFSTTALKSKGLAAFLQDVRDKTGGNIDTMASLFGSVKALNAVMTLTGEGGMAVMKSTLAEMETNTTALDDAFETMTSTSAEQFKITVNELKNVAIALGEELLPVVNDLLNNYIKPFVSKLGDLVKKFQEASPETKKLIGLIVGFAAAIGPTLMIVGKLTTGMGGMIARVVKAVAIMGKGGGLVSILGALITPAGLVIAALVAVAAAVYLVTRAVGKSDRDLKAFIANLNTYYAEQADLMKGDIDAKYDAQKQSIQDQKNLLDEEIYNKQQAHDAAAYFAQSEYELNIEAAERSHDRKIDLLNDEKQALTDNYNDSISRIRDEYGVDTSYIKSKTDAVNDSYSSQISAANKAHNVVMGNIQKEYDKKINAINETVAATIAGIDAELAATLTGMNDKMSLEMQTLQAEIDAIDGLTTQEDEAAKAKAEADKIASLESRILAEEDVGKKTELINELAEIRSRQAREAVLEEREIEKAAIVEKQNELKAMYEQEKLDATAAAEELRLLAIETAEGERTAAAEARTLQLENEKGYIADRTRSLEGARDDAIRFIQEERIEAEAKEKGIYDAAIIGINERLLAEDERIELIKGVYASDLEDYAKFQKDMTALAIAGIQDRKAALDEDLEGMNASITTEKSNVDRILGEQKKQRAITESNRLNDQKWYEKMGVKNTAPFEQLEAVAGFLRKITGGGDDEKNMMPGMPGYAGGTNFHPGGLALVGEGGQPEVVNLPRGSQVTPLSELENVGGGIVMNVTQYITDKATADYANADLTRRLQGRGAERSFR
jgi:TP901 family phage tail tape measure protein